MLEGEHQDSAEGKEAPVVEEEAPREVQIAAPTMTQMSLMEVMVAEAILPLRLEAGVEVRRAGDLGPDQRVALLAAAMEGVLVEEQGFLPEVTEARWEVQVAASAMTQKKGVTAVVEPPLPVRV